MKKESINIANDQRHPHKRRRRGGRRSNWEMTLGRKTVSFSVKNPVYYLLNNAAESRKLQLSGFIRNIVFEWIANNLRSNEAVPTLSG